MSKASAGDNKKALVPKLRFPEFAASKAWSTDSLKNLVTAVAPPKKLLSSTYKTTGRFPIVDQSKDYICGWTDDESATITDTLPLLVFGDHTCELKIVNEPFAQGADGIKILSAGKRLTATFLYQYLLHSPVVMASYRRHYAILKEKIIPLPDVESGEQQKIADCLSSLDALIAAHTDKLAALKTHKQGLLQQLFPQPGEIVPRLRFPEFRHAGEWAHRELGGMTTKVGSGITPKGGSANYQSAGRMFVRSQNVGWGQLLLDDVVYIADSTHATFAATEIQLNDVLLNISGASIGRSSIADQRLVGGNVNQHVCIIRTKKSRLNPTYLNKFILSEYGQNQIDSFQAGGNRQGLNFGQIRSLSIPLPRDYDEQQKIADCLSSLDTLITAQTDKIAALKQHKHGLLQQLFPTMGEAAA